MSVIPAKTHDASEPGTIDISQLFFTTTTEIGNKNVTHTNGSVEFEVPNKDWLW